MCFVREQYHFKCVALTERLDGTFPMVNGTTLQSQPIATKFAEYQQAWFFEDEVEVEALWRIFFGIPMDGVEMKMNKVDYRFLNRFTMSHTKERCYTGVCCMLLEYPGDFPGGAYVDVMCDDGRQYEYSAMVYHTADPAVGGDCW